MPRSRGGAGASRPSRAPAPRPSVPTQQTRPSTTAAYPGQAPGQAQRAAPQQQTGSGGGLLGQMASTAAYVPLAAIDMFRMEKLTV
jgi:coiled-coil-helix-coiled-coil-helix domain-containing protein 2